MKQQREPGMPPAKGKTSGSGKWSKYREQPVTTTVTWDEVGSALLVDAIYAVTNGGDAILLGAVRNGSALVMTICSGDERIKFYATTAQEMEDHLRNVATTADA